MQSFAISIDKKSLCALWALAILLAAGCGGPAREDHPGRTASLRQSLDPKAQIFLGDAEEAWRRRDYAAVFRELDSAATYAPRLADIPFRRGRAYVEVNRLDDARTAFDETLAMDPYYPGAWFALGNIEFRERRYEAAVNKYMQEEVVLTRLFKQQVAEPEARPSSLAATRLQLGRAHDRLGHVDAAYESFDRAIEADSTFAEAYYELSQLYETDGEFETALSFARRAFSADSNSADNQYAVGALLLKNGKAGEAVPYLRASLLNRPWYHPALHNLGRALLQLGQRESAEALLARADAMQALQLDIVQARLDAQQYPNDAPRWIGLARVLTEAGRYDEAEDAFDTAVYLEPANLAYQNDAANLQLLRGDADDAIARFQGILRNDSTMADSWMNLGVAYALSGRSGEAREAWERVLTYDPDHEEAKANLARLSELQ